MVIAVAELVVIVVPLVGSDVVPGVSPVLGIGTVQFVQSWYVKSGRYSYWNE